MKLLLAEDDAILRDGLVLSLQQAGYATDPNYAQKLIGVIRQFDLV